MHAVPGSWGGSSVFVKQFIIALRHCGIRHSFSLRGQVDAIFLVDPRDDLQAKAFGLKEILDYRRKNNGVKVIHRINECDQRKGTTFMDELLHQSNETADYTVFISEWLRDYFIQRWFDPSRPHRVIYNAADPSVFHPVGGNKYDGNCPLRLVTHHWSANPMKGFPVYKMIDDMIADGDLKDTELWVIGRWPTDINWRSARTFSPASGRKLADLLRQCHVYVTASLWEPCGMHHVEGAQCGLPLLYHENGGGIVEAGKKYGIGFREETLTAAIEEMRVRYREMRRLVLDGMPNGVRMASDYVRIVQRLLADRQ
ncbi:MAG: glycosyltransferase family 4 protein [Deltaproteobacteria bacterium]|nr:glycosyltransferase family 4 protein [Deltaproteobacteria bacterium]MBW2152209.1 glycosyltransferase family 4 protein [Deltaproteobacteria bacterium]